MAATLSPDERAQALAALPGWALAMNTFCPARLRSMRVDPSAIGDRMISAPNLS